MKRQSGVITICVVFVFLLGGVTYGVDWRSAGREYQYKTKDYPKAVEAYTSAIKANTNDAESYLHRGGAYFALRKYPETIDDISKGLQLSRPDFPHGWLHIRGMAKLQLGRLEEALRDLSEAVDVGNQYLRSSLLASNPRLGAKSEARREVAKIYQDRAFLYGKLGRSDLAARDSTTVRQVCEQRGILDKLLRAFVTEEPCP